MVARNSLGVVAPISRISPRASCGLSMLAASMAPSAAPAPTMVCSSSINRMMFPFSAASVRQFFRRSSKSPRYLRRRAAPADPAQTAAYSAWPPVHCPVKFSGRCPPQWRSFPRRLRRSDRGCFGAAGEDADNLLHLLSTSHQRVIAVGVRRIGHQPAILKQSGAGFSGDSVNVPALHAHAVGTVAGTERTELVQADAQFFRMATALQQGRG